MPKYGDEQYAEMCLPANNCDGKSGRTLNVCREQSGRGYCLAVMDREHGVTCLGTWSTLEDVAEALETLAENTRGLGEGQ